MCIMMQKKKTPASRTLVQLLIYLRNAIFLCSSIKCNVLSVCMQVGIYCLTVKKKKRKKKKCMTFFRKIKILIESS